jgi:AraC-like DNA-binding protein
MLTRLDSFDLHFILGECDFHVSNIVLECFERSIPLHSHSKNSYEIHYIPSGHGTASINGNSYPIVPNTLFVTGPFIEHAQVPDRKDPMCEYCIYLKIGRSTSPSASLAEKALVNRFRQIDFWFGQDSQDIHPLMIQLFTELEHRYTGYSIQAEILLKQLIIKLVRNYEGNIEGTPHTDTPNLVDNKYLIIEECFLYEYRTLSLDILASRLGLGIRQTERLLKEHYGKTFLQKKTEARMSAASILLQNPELSITQIAEETGYSCIEHFSASFKRYYGCSATSYRKHFVPFSS